MNPIGYFLYIHTYTLRTQYTLIEHNNIAKSDISVKHRALLLLRVPPVSPPRYGHYTVYIHLIIDGLMKLRVLY